MRHPGRNGKISLSAFVSLLLASSVSLSMTASNSVTVAAPVRPILSAADTLPDPFPVISDREADILLKATGSESLGVVAGGASGKLWIYDAKYRQLASSIWADGMDGRNVARFVGPHNWNYPDLHDAHALCVNRDYTRIYSVIWMTYDEPSYLVEYDPMTLKETRRAAVGRGGHHCAFTPDGQSIYVGNQYETFMSIIDVATMTKVTDIELGGMSIYPSHTYSRSWWTIDADGKPTVAVINTPYMFITIAGTPPVSNTVPAPGGSPVVNGVGVIDWTTHTLVGIIPIGTSVHEVNLTPDGTEAWVTQPGGESSVRGVPGTGDVTVIDVATLTIKTRFKLGVGAIHQVFSRDNRFAYITGGNTLNKVDRRSYSVIWTAVGESSLAHLGLSPDEEEIWILNHAMSKTRYPYLIRGADPCGVQVFSAQNGSLIHEMVHEDVAHEMAFVPRSMFGTPSTSVNPAVALGQAVFTRNCAVCHGPDAGGSGIAPSLKDGTWYNNAAGVVAIVKAGRGGVMPAWDGILSPEEIQQVAAYIASLGKPEH
jgi:YVTN family beta-propeller protein